MSYDVEFMGENLQGETWKNYTSNVSRMWTKALGVNLGDLIIRTPSAWEIIYPIERGIERMESDPPTYRLMEPDNKWGSYEGALAYLRWIAETAKANPTATITVSR